MKIKNIVKLVKKEVKKNASTGLIIAGGIGIITSVYFAVEETKKAKDKEKEPETIPEKIADTIVTYPKTIATVTITFGCIGAAHFLDQKEIAGLGALLATQVKRNKKVNEVLTDEQKKEVDNSIVQEYLFCPDETTAIRTGHGDILVHDPYSGHFFYSCQNHILNAAYRINVAAGKNKDTYITLDDFYDEIGLPTNTYFSNTHGFEFDPEDADSGIQIYFDSGKTPDGLPYLIMRFYNDPVEI